MAALSVCKKLAVLRPLGLGTRMRVAGQHLLLAPSLSACVARCEEKTIGRFRCFAARASTSTIANAGAAGAPPIPPRIEELQTAEDMHAARVWTAAFASAGREALTRETRGVELAFARSSGPGGQNVNKVNTKCTLRCALGVPWIPVWARVALRKCPAYVASSDSLQLTSMQYRSQAQNVDDCLAKLKNLIVIAALSGIKNEPSDAQKARVVGLAAAEKARRRRDKEHRSETKQRRKKGDWD